MLRKEVTLPKMQPILPKADRLGANAWKYNCAVRYGSDVDSTEVSLGKLRCLQGLDMSAGSVTSTI